MISLIVGTLAASGRAALIRRKPVALRVGLEPGQCNVPLSFPVPAPIGHDGVLPFNASSAVAGLTGGRISGES